MNKTIIFFHLNRTGGVTFKDILSKQYKNVFDIRQGKDFKERVKDLIKMPVGMQKEIELIQGHQYFGIHQILPQPCQYITMLRSPLQRVVSAYQYYKSTWDAPEYRDANKYKIEEWMEMGIKLSFNDGMVRKLSMWPDNEVGWGKVTEEHLETAKKRLEKYFIFGLTEQYDQTLVLLQQELGWKLPLYSKAHFTKKSHVISHLAMHVQNLINKYNKLDTELYIYASVLFFKRYSQIPDFTKKVKQFKLVNRIIGRFYIGARLQRLINRRFYGIS